MCFLFLLKHTDKLIIQQWLKRESIGFIKRFFFVVYFCIRSFQFLDKEIWLERMMESSEVKSSAVTKATIENFYSSGGVPKRTSYRQRAPIKGAGESSSDSKFTRESMGSERAFKRTLKRNNTHGTSSEVTTIQYNEILVGSFFYIFCYQHFLLRN